MPDRSSRPKRPRDLNELAAAIVGDAVDEPTMLAPETPAKNPAAVELGRLGGKKGGRARATKLTPERRREIAKKAAAARWNRDH
jgi:hypothetical protein